MKKTLNSILLGAFVLFASVATAGDKNEKNVSPELDVKIHQIDQSKVMVAFEKLEGEVVTVTISNPSGIKIFSDQKEEGIKYVKSFDISEYPAGRYSYSVDNGRYSVTKVIEKK